MINEDNEEEFFILKVEIMILVNSLITASSCSLLEMFNSCLRFIECFNNVLCKVHQSLTYTFLWIGVETISGHSFCCSYDGLWSSHSLVWYWERRGVWDQVPRAVLSELLSKLWRTSAKSSQPLYLQTVAAFSNMLLTSHSSWDERQAVWFYWALILWANLP